MVLHNKRMMYAVRVDQPNPQFATMLLEQFGGPNGELAAAMRYFTQAWADPDPARRDMLLDIATEELSHLEMVGQTLVQLLKGSPGAEVDEVEKFVEMSLTSGPTILGGGGPRLTDSMGTPWTAASIDSLGQPEADLRSDIAAEARAKIVYERLIKLCDDAGCKDTLTFLMTREIAHQKMFEAALDAIPKNFPPGTHTLAHQYYKDSENGGAHPGYDLAEKTGGFGFELIDDPVAGAPTEGAL